MRIFGLPLDEQKALKNDDKALDSAPVEDTTTASAVYVRVFASDFLPFTGESKDEISRMFGRTFAISGQTRLELVYAEACKYWGVTSSEFSLWYEEGKEIVEADKDDMTLKVQTIMDRFNNSESEQDQ